MATAAGSSNFCIQGVDVASGKKKVAIFFEQEADRLKFKTEFAKSA